MVSDFASDCILSNSYLLCINDGAWSRNNGNNAASSHIVSYIDS